MRHTMIQKMALVIISSALLFTGCASATSTTLPTASSSEVSDVNTAVPMVPDAELTYPLSITHAFGTTVIEAKPERIATISWGNQDLPLALGIVPVGVSTANYGVLDDSGLLPWTKAAFEALGVTSPTRFDDVSGLNYEAISNTHPDVILAAYSGITEEEYTLLSQIAPVIAYPDRPWQTLWRDQITLDALGMGMPEAGQALIANLESTLSAKIKNYPELNGKSAAFFYFNPLDLGKFYIYLPADPRVAYLGDLGMIMPESILTLASQSDSFALEFSAENIDMLSDIDIVVAYGSEGLLETLQADSLIGKMPAIAKGAVALIEDGTPLAAAGTPSALSIPATLDEYLGVLSKAAAMSDK